MYIDTRKHDKIWFSSNRDVFMPMENQLRLIKMRVDNPSAEISMVYSESLLSTDAQEKLKEFSNHHNIRLVNFDSMGERYPTGSNNRKTFDLARRELEDHKQGGDVRDSQSREK